MHYSSDYIGLYNSGQVPMSMNGAPQSMTPQANMMMDDYSQWYPYTWSQQPATYPNTALLPTTVMPPGSNNLSMVPTHSDLTGQYLDNLARAQPRASKVKCYSWMGAELPCEPAIQVQSTSPASCSNTMSPQTHFKDSDLRKRQRHSYTNSSKTELEKEFYTKRYLNKTERVALAAQLNLHERQVKIWFQNRRMKDKRDRRLQEGASGTNSTAGGAKVAGAPCTQPSSTVRTPVVADFLAAGSASTNLGATVDPSIASQTHSRTQTVSLHANEPDRWYQEAVQTKTKDLMQQNLLANQQQATTDHFKRFLPEH